MNRRFLAGLSVVVVGPAALLSLDGCRALIAKDDVELVSLDGSGGGGGDDGSIRRTEDGSLIVDPPGASGIAAGPDWVCAIKRGVLHCWGNNTSDDRLGRPELDGGSTGRPGPVAGSDPRGFLATQVSMARYFGCTQSATDKAVYCFGGCLNGWCGGSGKLNGSAVVGFDGDLGDIQEVAVGSSFACARNGAMKVFCWGDHAQSSPYGQITSDYDDRVYDGGSWFNSFCTKAFPIPLLDGTRHIAVGDDHGCAVRTDGAVVCWGRNDLRQSGRAVSDACHHYETAARPQCLKKPAVVAGLTNVKQLALGRRHSCALEMSGRVLCWGANDDAQLGSGSAGSQVCNETEVAGTTVRCTETPVHIPKVDGAEFIAVNGETSCAVKGGEVLCWGSNYSKLLGHGGTDFDTSAIPTPVEVEGGGTLKNMAQLALGEGFACALGKDESLYCWGHKLDGSNVIRDRAEAVPW